MNAQEFEDRSNLRLKFASMDQSGCLTRDASEEYASFFAEMPAGWSVAGPDLVNTLRFDGNQAWFLRTETEEIVAVEHETGIEFLLAVGASVASSAVVALVSWGWKKWRDSRAQGIQTGTKAEPTLVLESVEDRHPNGQIRRSRKLEIRGPIDHAGVAAALRQWRAGD